MKFFSLVVLLVFSLKTYAATENHSVELQGELVFVNLESSATYEIGGRYATWINPYFAYFYGCKLSKSKLSKSFMSPKSENIEYIIDDNIILNLNGILGVEILSPAINNVGLFGSFCLEFDPLPFNMVSIDTKFIDNPNYRNTESKMVFTHFNTAYSLEYGIYWNTKNGNRLTFGFSSNSFNPYNMYSHAKINGLKLKDFLKLEPEKAGFSILMKFSCPLF